MKKDEKRRFVYQAKITKALAHPTRLFIVDRIAREEICVCQLSKLLDIDVSTVSKHLSLLKAAGLVEVEKRGLMIFPRLKVSGLDGMFAFLDNVLQSNSREMMAALP